MNEFISIYHRKILGTKVKKKLPLKANNPKFVTTWPLYELVLLHMTYVNINQELSHMKSLHLMKT